MTTEKCAAASTGYTYFGTEYGREVRNLYVDIRHHTKYPQFYCGSTPAAGSVKVQEAYCSFTCSGDATQTCGARDHLTTYALTGTVPVDTGATTTYGSLGC